MMEVQTWLHFPLKAVHKTTLEALHKGNRSDVKVCKVLSNFSLSLSLHVLVMCTVEEHFLVPEMTVAIQVRNSFARTVVLSSIWLEQGNIGFHYKFDLQVPLSLTDTQGER